MEPHRERVPSFSSQVSSLTDDDDKSSSLHVLSDEQLDHLTYEYNPYTELSYETGTNIKTFQQPNNLLPESLLY